MHTRRFARIVQMNRLWTSYILWVALAAVMLAALARHTIRHIYDEAVSAAAQSLEHLARDNRVFERPTETVLAVFFCVMYIPAVAIMSLHAELRTQEVSTSCVTVRDVWKARM
jgi:hypothetical protein